MELRPLGMSGVLVSVIGLGTWPMGGEWWGGTDDAEAIRTIQRAIALGVTLIDTAEAYAQGHAEQVLGRAIATRRQDVVIADKVAADHLRPHDIRAAFEASCRRLGTDYLDVYFVHWPNIDLPLADAIGELERLREAGNIRAIGVSNFTTDELAEAGRYGRIDVLQPPYNLFWRFCEQAELPYCRADATCIDSTIETGSFWVMERLELTSCTRLVPSFRCRAVGHHLLSLAVTTKPHARVDGSLNWSGLSCLCANTSCVIC